jgi:hypothetical protein
MSAGTVTFSYLSSTPVPLINNSCLAVRSAALQHYNNNMGSPSWSPVSCSTDPVIVGTVINWANGMQAATWTVMTISATTETTDLNKVDFDPLISVIIPCFFILLFFVGFHTGTQNGNR